MRDLLSVALFVTIGALVGCHHHDDANAHYVDDQPGGQFGEVAAQRATFDLSCPRERLTVQQIGGDSFGVTGCGQKASYTCVCMWHSWSECTKPLCQLDGAQRAPANAAAKSNEPAIQYSPAPSASPAPVPGTTQ